MTDMAAATGPLEGIRVIDLTSVVMGPVATRTLGDLGADVIMVERDGGDRNRSMGPGPHEEFSGVSLNLLRNKRSVALDLKRDEGRATFLDIAATCDVMVTNLRPAPLNRLGLGYEVVRNIRQDIVFCQAHGYPSDSEQADAPAYDDIIQSASGVGDLFRLMGQPPSLLPTLVADKVCGMAIANAILAALFHRSTTGQGQHIEVPMIDVMRAFVLTEHGSGAISEPPVGAAGYPRILTPERRPQQTADGWINVLPYDAEHYVAIFGAGDRHDLVSDERFMTRRGRTVNSDSLYRDVASVLPKRTTAQWLTFFAEHQIPATESASLEELVAELPLGDHPLIGPYRVIPPPEIYSETPSQVRRHAPSVGEHTYEVLLEIGYDQTKVDSLAEQGVI